jgi:hypothetical protein
MPAPLAAPSSKCTGPDDSDFSVISSSSFPLPPGEGEDGPSSRSRAGASAPARSPDASGSYSVSRDLSGPHILRAYRRI